MIRLVILLLTQFAGAVIALYREAGEDEKFIDENSSTGASSNGLIERNRPALHDPLSRRDTRKSAYFSMPPRFFIHQHHYKFDIKLTEGLLSGLPSVPRYSKSRTLRI